MKCTKCGQKVKTLKVGDKVEAIGKVSGLNLKGKQGVVVKVDNDPEVPVLVEFDKPFLEGHSGLGDGKCKNGHGRWGRPNDFKVIKAEGKG